MKAPSRRALMREFSGKHGYVVIVFEPGQRKDGDDATMVVQSGSTTLELLRLLERLALELMHDDGHRKLHVMEPP